MRSHSRNVRRCRVSGIKRNCFASNSVRPFRQKLSEKAFFFRSNRRPAPDARSNIATERLFQKGNDAMADAITQRRKIAIGCVFAKFQMIRFNIPIDLLAPDAEKRTNNRQLDIIDATGGDLSHSSKSRRPSTTK